MKKIFVFIAIMAIFAGCKKQQEPEPPKNEPKKVIGVDERMADKEYVKKLENQRTAQKLLAQKLQEAKTPEDRAALQAALEKLRQQSMATIRQKMKGQ